VLPAAQRRRQPGPIAEIDKRVLLLLEAVISVAPTKINNETLQRTIEPKVYGGHLDF
jgi:hypothetical protein